MVWCSSKEHLYLLGVFQQIGAGTNSQIGYYLNIIIDNNFSCVHLSLSIEDLVSPLGDVQSSAIVCGQH